VTLEGDPVGIVEMLYVSSTVVVVGAKDRGTFSPKHVTFWNTNEDIIGAELSFISPIKRIQLNHTRLLIGLEDVVYIYDYDLREVARIKLCSASVKCALSPTAEFPYLAISSGMLGEELIIHDVTNGKLLTSFKAHESPVHRLAFNERGTMLGSASTKVS
jgi:autophagy-related protein 18